MKLYFINWLFWITLTLKGISIGLAMDPCIIGRRKYYGYKLYPIAECDCLREFHYKVMD